MILSIFSGHFGHLYVFFREMSIYIFLYFFIFFYIELLELFVYFGRLIPCQSVHLQIFSFVRYLFILFMVSFAVQKLLSLISPICLLLFLF